MKYFLLTICLIAGTLTINAQTEKEKVESTITKSQIEGHIYFLADDLLKGRATGSDENKIAASYLANTFRGYGVKPNPKTGTYYQEVHLQKIAPPSESSISINETKISKFAILNPNEIDFNGDAIYLGFGLEEDYKGKDVSNKVIIIKAGNSEDQEVRTAFRSRKEKTAMAKKNGVLGIIELVNTTQQTWTYIDHNFNGDRLVVKEVSDSEKEKSNFVYTLSLIHI